MQKNKTPQEHTYDGKRHSKNIQVPVIFENWPLDSDRDENTKKGRGQNARESSPNCHILHLSHHLTISPHHPQSSMTSEKTHSFTIFPSAFIVWVSACAHTCRCSKSVSYRRTNLSNERSAGSGRTSGGATGTAGASGLCAREGTKNNAKTNRTIGAFAI